MNAAKLITATALFTVLGQQAGAENRIPAEMTLPISPDYRTVDVDINRGTQFVWVHHIEGRDSAGNIHVLFHDMQGALLALDQLSHVERLINPQEVSHKGSYSELKLQLAGHMLAVSDKGMQRTALAQGLEPNVALQGILEVSEFEVIGSGIKLQGSNSARLALLEH